jgi:hypothetical protein
MHTATERRGYTEVVSTAECFSYNEMRFLDRQSSHGRIANLSVAPGVIPNSKRFKNVFPDG